MQTETKCACGGPAEWLLQKKFVAKDESFCDPCARTNEDFGFSSLETAWTEIATGQELHAQKLDGLYVGHSSVPSIPLELCIPLEKLAEIILRRPYNEISNFFGYCEMELRLQTNLETV
jgi:hypothetical protein